MAREELGEFRLFMEFHDHDEEYFFKYTRMNPRNFDILLKMVESSLSHSGPRKSVLPAERLAVTLRYLSTGDSQQTIAFSYRLGRSTVCNIIRETCVAIYDSLGKIYLSPPTTEEMKKISQEFWHLWNFPSCIGAIDGKHCLIQAPKLSGSEFFNYKKTFSVVLLAIADAQYCFSVIDVGCPGRVSDGGVLKNSVIYEKLENDSFGVPEDEFLPGTNIMSPYVMVGDEAFPLKRYMMRPYPGKQTDFQKSAFNYRLSRARRIVENTFGILSSRWRVFRRPIIANPENVVHFIKAACVLHNFLKKTDVLNSSRTQYCPTNFVDAESNDGVVVPGSWREITAGDMNFTMCIKPTHNRYKQSGNMLESSSLLSLFLMQELCLGKQPACYVAHEHLSKL